MERRSLGADDTPPANNHSSSFIHGHVRKRQRSNPGPDTVSHDDMLGGGSWRYSPVSDPDIDYNIQSSKRYLSEVMANNLTRHMSLRPTNSAGAAPPSAVGASGNSVDDMLGLAHQQGTLAPFPAPHPFAQPPGAQNPYGPGPLTPPGGCSPQRTCISEMSEGLPDPGGEILQPMNTSDASISVSMSHGNGGAGAPGGKTSVTPTPESTSETADSELLDERERSVSLSGMLWGPGSGAPTPGYAVATAAGVSIPFDVMGAGRQSLSLGAVGASAAAQCGSSAAAPSASTCSPFSLGALSRRLSDASQGAMVAGPARTLQQTQQQQMMAMRGPYPRGYVAGGRGVLADIPTSPSDTRFGGLDLRKTALLRSISRRTEETPLDGGTAAAVAGYNLSGGAASAACVGGVIAYSANSECGTGVATATIIGTGIGMAVTRCLPVERCGGGGDGARSVVSRSDSGFSDAMSEGGGGSGGGGGGATGMELSSNSADCGGGGGTLVATVLGQHLDQQQQQQHEQQLLIQQLLMQQQQHEESGEALLPGQQQHVHLVVQPSQLCGSGLPGISCVVNVNSDTSVSRILATANSCSRGSPPAGVATPLPLGTMSSMQTQHPRGDRSSATPPSQPRCL